MRRNKNKQTNKRGGWIANENSERVVPQGLVKKVFYSEDVTNLTDKPTSSRCQSKKKIRTNIKNLMIK